MFVLLFIKFSVFLLNKIDESISILGPELLKSFFYRYKRALLKSTRVDQCIQSRVNATSFRKHSPFIIFDPAGGEGIL